MRRPILLLCLLAACSPKSGSTRHDRALDTAATAPKAETVLPTPIDSFVSWSQITKLVRSTPDSIRAVQQLHTRAVTVLFKDGRRYHATEPGIDDIIHLLKEVDPAGRVLIATE